MSRSSDTKRVSRKNKPCGCAGSISPDRLEMQNDEPSTSVTMPSAPATHALASYLQVDGFDVVTDHAGIVGPICGALRRGDPPVVHTLHGPWTEQNRVLYALLSHHVHLVAVSDAQRAANLDVPYAGTVHN